MIVNDSSVGGRRPTGLLTSLRSFRRLGAALGLRGSVVRAGVGAGWGCDLNLTVMVVGSSIETRAPLHVDGADDGLTGARPAERPKFRSNILKAHRIVGPRRTCRVSAFSYFGALVGWLAYRRLAVGSTGDLIGRPEK